MFGTICLRSHPDITNVVTNSDKKKSITTIQLEARNVVESTYRKSSKWNGSMPYWTALPPSFSETPKISIKIWIIYQYIVNINIYYVSHVLYIFLHVNHLHRHVHYVLRFFSIMSIMNIGEGNQLQNQCIWRWHLTITMSNMVILARLLSGKMGSKIYMVT